MLQIDLNADVGEECGDDAALFALVSSGNIACGWHAGSPEVMRATLRLAAERNVACGAHPSYPDRANFGRIALDRSAGDVYDDVVTQIELLERIAREEGVSLRHVKAHGALYNVAARNRAIADAISRATARVLPGAALYGLSGGEQMASARAFGLRAIAEGFADRRYRADGTLVPRSEPDALIDDEEEAVAQALELARSGRAQTICLHGDGAHAIAFARRIRAAFEEAGIAIASPRTGS